MGTSVSSHYWIAGGDKGLCIYDCSCRNWGYTGFADDFRMTQSEYTKVSFYPLIMFVHQGEP